MKNIVSDQSKKMNKNTIQQIIYFAIWIVILVGLSGTIPLVQNEFANGDICPKIIGIPACYIILTCLILAILSHLNLFKDKKRLYFLGVLTALSIATFGTVGNLLGYVECPKTDGGTPMCYLSFLIFFSLLVLKIVEKKKPATT